jgi:hypothetical protein
MKSLVLGLGEVGSSLFEVLKLSYFDSTVGYDIKMDKEGKLRDDIIKSNLNEKLKFDIIHVCIPFKTYDGFKEALEPWISGLTPKYFVVHSTVEPGTTSKLNQHFEGIVKGVLGFHSPINGKHTKEHGLVRGILENPKYIGLADSAKKEYADESTGYLLEQSGLSTYFKNAGISLFWSIDSTHTEWMKLLATSYYAYLIAWRQEVERIADKYDLDQEEISSILNWDVPDFKGQHFSGVILGHCLIPNILIIVNKLWKDSDPEYWKAQSYSAFDFVLDSNEVKKRREEK